MIGSEIEYVESHTELLCLDGDLDLLYSLLKESSLTKKKAKEFIKYTINLDKNTRKLIAQGRSRLLQSHYVIRKSNPANENTEEIDENLTNGSFLNQEFPSLQNSTTIQNNVNQNQNLTVCVYRNGSLTLPAGKIIELKTFV